MLCASTAHAQFGTTQWTADDGLPQNSVRGIAQTSDGYLWIATLNGLARFDGVRFTVFDKSNTPGMSSARFMTMIRGANDEVGWRARTTTPHVSGSGCSSRSAPNTVSSPTT